MNFILYLFLIITPIPLFYLSFKCKHHLYLLLPIMALFGIYLMNIIGSIAVINDDNLFSYEYYISLLIIIVMFYMFYVIVLSLKYDMCIDWGETNYENNRSITLFLVVLWAYAFYMLYLYYTRHGLPSLFYMSLFDYVNIYELRAQKTTNIPEGMHWYRVGWSYVPQFVFIYTYILKVLYRSRKYRLLFYFNLPLVLFFSSLTLSKSVYVYLLLSLLLVNLLIKGKQYDLRRIGMYIGGGIVTMILMIRLYLLDRGFIDVLQLAPYFLYRRICTLYTKAHAYIIQIFPDQHDFFYGLTFGNPGHILPYDPVNLSQFLGYWVYGRLVNYSSPSFSQGYANFGWLGFILIILIMFLQIVLLQIVFKKCPKIPLFLAIYVMIVPRMLGYANTSIQAIISEPFILFSMTCVFAYYFSRDFMMSLAQDKRVVNFRRPLQE